LKIAVSVVRFRPWAPTKYVDLISYFILKTAVNAFLIEENHALSGS